MINFFRKIRRKLADSNQFFKYSRYAIGEIVLVVIGILIALSINNWNEERKQENRSINYINKITNDLETDLKNIDSLIVRGKHNVKVIENYFNYFENQNPVNIQKLIDSCSQIIGHEIFKYRYTPTNYTFKDMLASGNSTLLSEEQRSALIKISNTQDFYLIVFEKVISSIIESESKMKTFIDSDLSPSDFFKKINVEQSENNLIQGLLHQHNALSSYSDLLFYTMRLEKRILKETETAMQTFKINH